MVEITIEEDGRGRPSSFSARGHSGWDEDGRDVVCAAVSTLLQSAWLGLAEVARVDVTGSKARGTLELRWPLETRDDPAVRAIVETTLRSLERIAMQYPDNVRTIRRSGDG